MSSRRQWTHFPYEARAAEVLAARKAVDETFARVTRREDDADPATMAWLAAITRFHAALAAAYPPGFWLAHEALKAGDPSGLEAAIGFLEADPWFFRSGYLKAELIKLSTRLPLTQKQAERLRAVVLDIVDRRDGQEFRSYCRLARKVDSAELRAALALRLADESADIRRRARWVLEAVAAGQCCPSHPAAC